MFTAKLNRVVRVLVPISFVIPCVFLWFIGFRRQRRTTLAPIIAHEFLLASRYVNVLRSTTSEDARNYFDPPRTRRANILEHSVFAFACLWCSASTKTTPGIGEAREKMSPRLARPKHRTLFEPRKAGEIF